MSAEFEAWMVNCQNCGKRHSPPMCPVPSYEMNQHLEDQLRIRVAECAFGLLMNRTSGIPMEDKAKRLASGAFEYADAFIAASKRPPV